MRKLPLILLTLSLVANITLVTKFLQNRTRPKSSTITPVADHSSLQRESGQMTTEDKLDAVDTATLQYAQELLATDDLPTLVNQLRKAGFSSMDIRGIISARLAERFGALRVAATAHLEVVPYWRSSMSFPRDPTSGGEVRRLFREQDLMMKQLLGEDYRASDDWSKMLFERQYGYLPAEKVNRLTSLLDDYQDIQKSVFDMTRGAMTAEARAKLELIKQERRADLATLLTPEELEAFDMHTSATANRLRYQLEAFQPTEEEYQTLYRLADSAGPVGQTRIGIGPFSVGSSPPQPELTELQKRIETALGPERAAAYQLKTNPEYLQLHRVAEQFDLPDTAVTAAYQTAQSIRQRAQAVLKNPTLPAATKADQLIAITNEAEAQLQAQLGAQVYETYQARSGQWLKNYQNQAETIRQTGK